VLVFYTDGLIERRDRALLDGLVALREVAAGATAVDAAGIGEELLARLADSPEDDVAVVVVRIPDLTDTSGHGGNVRSRRWQLPSEPGSIARARHAVLRTSHAWELGDASNAELVVSELVANAVLHGWGRVTLRLHDTGDGLRIEVEDSNPTPPVATEGHPGRIGGFGMRIVERLADWGWRPSRGGKVVWARVRPSVPSVLDGPQGGA
jgi:anti-sigma regulatory factor (Ser/Thr protein kinase)